MQKARMKWGKGKKYIVTALVSGKLQEAGKEGFEPTWQGQWELEEESVESQIIRAKRMEDRRTNWLKVSKKNGK